MTKDATNGNAGDGIDELWDALIDLAAILQESEARQRAKLNLVTDEGDGDDRITTDAD